MITFDDIIQAQESIAPYIIKTPLLRVKVLDAYIGAEVYLKPENLQSTGSFKLRGATNKLLSLTAEERAKGVVTASSGNHAQGVACAAQRLGVNALIVMPTNANPAKLEGARAFGATVIQCGTTGTQREEKMSEIITAEGRIMVHAFDDPYVMAGQGTIGLEIMADQPDMDVIVVPVGGGGLISGVATAAKNIKPDIRIIGMEPTAVNRYAVSRQEGHPVSVEMKQTIADGTRTDMAHQFNFEHIEALVDELVAIEDEWIEKGMRGIILKAKIIAEPSSSMGVGAALAGKLRLKPTDKVCFVISGGNVDPKQVGRICGDVS